MATTKKSKAVIPEALDTHRVKIGTLKPHPRNPRRGNEELLRQSLRAHGQYRPIIYQLSTRFILAGNHTWRGAKAEGWKEIAAVGLDVDDDQASRILAIDNRSAHLADYDVSALVELLESLPTLDSTGYTADDLDDLLAENVPELPEEDFTGGFGESEDELAARRSKVRHGDFQPKKQMARRRRGGRRWEP